MNKLVNFDNWIIDENTPFGSGASIKNWLVNTAVHDKVVLYSYDSDGLRASKSVNGSKTDYIWDGQNIVAEINNGTLTNKYIRGINLKA